MQLLLETLNGQSHSFSLYSKQFRTFKPNLSTFPVIYAYIITNQSPLVSIKCSHYIWLFPSRSHNGSASSLEAFKARLDVALGSLVQWLATIIVIIFNPGHSMILWFRRVRAAYSTARHLAAVSIGSPIWNNIIDSWVPSTGTLTVN